MIVQIFMTLILVILPVLRSRWFPCQLEVMLRAHGYYARCPCLLEFDRKSKRLGRMQNAVATIRLLFSPSCTHSDPKEVPYHQIAMLGAGSTAFFPPRSPPSGAKVTGEIRLTQGTYLYTAVGQQPASSGASPGKLRHSITWQPPSCSLIINISSGCGLVLVEMPESTTGPYHTHIRATCLAHDCLRLASTLSLDTAKAERFPHTPAECRRRLRREFRLPLHLS